VICFVDSTVSYCVCANMTVLQDAVTIIYRKLGLCAVHCCISEAQERAAVVTQLSAAVVSVRIYVCMHVYVYIPQ
jgi:hypothetical protein